MQIYPMLLLRGAGGAASGQLAAQDGQQPSYWVFCGFADSTCRPLKGAHRSVVVQPRRAACYSTVTLFARFLGWSTSVPFNIAQ